MFRQEYPNCNGMAKCLHPPFESRRWLPLVGPLLSLHSPIQLGLICILHNNHSGSGSGISWPYWCDIEESLTMKRGDVSRQFIAGLRSQQSGASASVPAEVPEEASGEVPAEVPAEASLHFAECLCNCAGNHHLTWCPMARSAVPAEASAEVPAAAEHQPNDFPFRPPPIPPWRILPLRGVPPNLPRMTGGPYTISYDTRTGQVSGVFSHATERYWNPTTRECWTMVDGQKVLQHFE